MDDVAELNKMFEKMPLGERADLITREFGMMAALASSFSAEDVMLMHTFWLRGGIRFFAIDTGRLPDEVFEVAEALRSRLGIEIEWYFPKGEDVERLLRERGAYSFRCSLEARRECCRIRKVEPLGRALVGAAAWVTGIRREHSTTRDAMAYVELDEEHGGILKFNPLLDVSGKSVGEYVRGFGLPQNRLYADGYRSIGCAPCSRAVADGEDERSGRWWWEDTTTRECGLHRHKILRGETRNGSSQTA